MLVYCLSKHLCPCLHMSARICARVCVCLQRLIYQNKCLWLPADGWPLGASLESPVTSCGGDRGREGKELTTNAGKTLAGWISVFSFNPFVHGRVLLSTLALFQHRPTSYSCTCTQSHLAAAQCSHCLLLYFISLSCSTGANRKSALLKGTLPVSVECLHIHFTCPEFPSWSEKFKIAAFWSQAISLIFRPPPLAEWIHFEYQMEYPFLHTFNSFFYIITYLQ